MKGSSVLLLSMLLFQSLTAHTQSLTNFSDLQNAVASGKTIKVSIHYARCTPIANGKERGKSSEAVGGFTVNQFDFTPRNSGKGNKDVIIFSHFSLTEASSGKGFLYDLIKLEVFEDAKVLISTHSVNPLTFESEHHEQFETEMFEGEPEEAGVYFYATTN